MSNAVVPSTCFECICQFLSNLIIMTAKSVRPSFVPCGTPPLTCFHDNNDDPMRTACTKLVRKERTQKNRVWLISKDLSSSSNTEWSMISNPSVKSAKNIQCFQKAPTADEKCRLLRSEKSATFSPKFK